MSKATNRAVNENNFLQLDLYSDEIVIKCSGGLAGIQVNYTGNIKIKSKHQRLGLPGWNLVASNDTGKILYFSTMSEPRNEGEFTMLSYVGEIETINCIGCFQGSIFHSALAEINDKRETLKEKLDTNLKTFSANTDRFGHGSDTAQNIKQNSILLDMIYQLLT